MSTSLNVVRCAVACCDSRRCSAMRRRRVVMRSRVSRPFCGAGVGAAGAGAGAEAFAAGAAAGAAGGAAGGCGGGGAGAVWQRSGGREHVASLRDAAAGPPPRPAWRGSMRCVMAAWGRTRGRCLGRGGGCRRGSSCWRGSRHARTLVDRADLFSHLHDVAFLLRLLRQHARFERRHLDRDLVGLELHQRFVLRDDVALLLQPPRDRRFHDRFSERWHLDRDHSAFI